MIDDARKEYIRREALECRTILRCALDHNAVDKRSAKNLINKYENGLDAEELDWFRTVLLLGNVETAAEFVKFLMEIEGKAPSNA